MKTTIPIKTISALNAREHWRARHRRVKAERGYVAMLLYGHKQPELPCVVTLTRLSPSNGLDIGDNLPSALKGTRDQIAEWLGIDDRSPLVTWRYEQRRAKDYGVEVEIS